MARTKDPHAATVKAWKTRSRAVQGSGSNATQLRETYSTDGPRWKGSDEWVNREFAKVLKKLPAPVREAVNKFLPSVFLDDYDSFQRGGYYRYTGGLKIGQASSASDIVHEVGHALDHALGTKDRRHPGPGTAIMHRGKDPWPRKFWSETDKEFARAYAADVRELKKRTEEYRDWEHAASGEAEGFAHTFAHLLGFPTEWSGGGVKAGLERAFPKSLAAVKKKLKSEGWL